MNMRTIHILTGSITMLISQSFADAQVLNEYTKLLAQDGAIGDAFGQAVAIHNGLAVIGASSDDDNGTNSGSAYIRHLILDGLPVKLTSNDGVAHDVFGDSVDIGSANNMGTNIMALVGTPNNSVFGESSGAAYLFSTSGTQLAKLVPNDGATGDNFGDSVAIADGVVVVGSPGDDDNGNGSGSAYLFNPLTGMQTHKLHPNNAAMDDRFGHAVAVSNGIVAVSALRHQNNGIESGSVYLFDASTGAQLAELSSNEGIQFEQFGYSLAMDQNTVAVGALATGSAYTFSTTTHALHTKITPLVPSSGFGWTIGIDDNMVVVGTPLEQTNTGAAFLFNAFTGIQLAKLLPSDGSILEQFGSSIAIDNDNKIVIVGSRNDGDNGSGSGSVYAFDIDCPADLNGDGVYNFFDISAFLTAFSNQNPIADFNNDGFFNFFDISAFLAAFAAGCP